MPKEKENKNHSITVNNSKRITILTILTVLIAVILYISQLPKREITTISLPKNATCPKGQVETTVPVLKEEFTNIPSSELDYKLHYDYESRCIEPSTYSPRNSMPDSDPMSGCSFDFDPVCGSDNKTYDSECYAEYYEVNVAYEGVCKAN